MRSSLHRVFQRHGMSSTNLRLRHLRTVFGFRQYCAATEAFDRCIAARTACLAAALP